MTDEGLSRNGTQSAGKPYMILVIHRFKGNLRPCREALRANTIGKPDLKIIDATGDQEGVSAAGADSMVISSERPFTVESHPGKQLIQTVNHLLKACRYSRVVFLDSTARTAPGWLEALDSCLETGPRPGLVGPLTEEHFSGLPQLVCGVPAQAAPFADLHAALQARHRHQRTAVRLPGVTCLGTRLATIRELEYLDETCVDIDVALADLGLRAQMVGYNNYLAGDMFVATAKRPPRQRWQTALRDKWESLDPGSDRRKHYEALNLRNQANNAHLREESDKAVELFLKGIGLYPDEPKLYLDLATMLAGAGRSADGLQAMDEMPVTGDLPEAQLLHGICQRGLGDLPAAEQAAERILALDKRSAAGWWLQGLCLTDRGKVKQATQALNESIICDPGYGPAVTALGRLAADGKIKGDALELLERGFTLESSVEAAADYHTAVTREGAYHRAIPFFAQALVMSPSSRRLRYLLIDLLLKTGAQSPAMEVIESMLAAFGVEASLLDAALAVREQLDPGVIGTADQPPVTLAFCLIVKDEERDLPRCLESIKPVADEIVVVDTGSQDRTRDVARVFGARVFDFQWCDDFAAAKNYAAEQAEADWIFSIDADEVLGRQDYEALRALIGAGHDRPEAYAVTTRNYLKVADVIGWQPNDGYYPEQAGIGWMPSEKVRLFPNDSRVRFSYPVHEMVEPSLARAGIPIVPCDIPVHHYGKLDQVRSLSKGEDYYNIGLKKLADMEQSTLGIRELAIQAQTLGDYQGAARLWERLLLLEPDQAQLYINLGSVYLELGEYNQAQKITQRARDLDPGIKESHFNHALIRLYQGDAIGAAGVLEDLAAAHPEYTAARFMLAAAATCTGDEARTRDLLDELLKTPLAAGLPEGLRHLAQGLEKAGQRRYSKRIASLADHIQ
ncbi:MAG: tetratricopeptide repeat protein [Desulfobacterales bacterium]|nr:tetratricopeptide repeat protein [Desulfobacterales bacterium]